MARTKQEYVNNGVEISKATLGVGDEVTLFYKGLLAQSGAEAVYAHIGYGEEWEDKTFIPMERDNDVFKATIRIDHPDDLNVAFKDSGDNWDNNSMANYSFKVSKRVSRKSSKSSDSEEKSQKKTSCKTSKTCKSAAAEKGTATKTATAKKTTASKAKKSTSTEK
ncbi:MAG: carbohydrate-binding protein [Clostridium sp.]|jgi:hypothetical protein|nr:carbohydrate-binding protein [Clostridium sp.]